MSAETSTPGWVSTLSLWLGTATLPSPHGPYAAGTCRIDVVVAPGRRVEVRAWYPAVAPKAGPREPYIEAPLADELARTFGAPRFLFREEESLAWRDAPRAPGPFPVLVFNHGFASFAKQNATLCEDLAMNGFVVLSLSHPGDSLLTTYTDGSRVVIDRARPAYRAFLALRADARRSVGEMARSFDALREATGDRARHHALLVALAQSTAYADLGPQITQWVEDTRGVLAQLPTLQAAGPLSGCIDIGRVGVFGHSLGGIVAGRVAQGAAPIRAAMSLDAPQLAEATDAPPRQQVPTCFMYGDKARQAGVTLETNRVNDGLLLSAPPGSCSVWVRGAAHQNFADLNNTLPLRWTPVLGTVDNRVMATFLRGFTRAWFRHHLDGAPRPDVSPAIGTLRWSDLPCSST